MPSSPAPSPRFQPAFSRPLWAQIDLQAVRANAAWLSAQAGGRPLIPVIKADAYGHGAVPIARALLCSRPEASALPPWRVAALAIASVDEGLQLREAGITQPLLLLSAVLPQEAPAIVESGLTATVFTAELAEALATAAARRGQPTPVHFKLDTGMGRCGATDEAVTLLSDIMSSPYLQLTGIYSHLACADEDEDPLTPRQLTSLQGLLRELKAQPDPDSVLVHLANSAALMRYAECYLDAVRPGLALYGAWPGPGPRPAPCPLQPVLSLHARVTAVKEVPAGTTVSYGAVWRAARPSRLALVPAGYGDGYRRALSGQAHALVGGVPCPLAGRVTMDQIILDVTDVPVPVQPGDNVELMGPGVPVEQWAKWANTIPWEIFCGLSRRVPRVLVGDAAP